jgi:hypothetical protein
MPVKQRRYAGELAKPIVWSNPPTFWGAVTKKRVCKYWRDYKNHRRKAEHDVNQKLLKKMSLLKKHFEITDQSDAAALAWALAFKHVPGFKIIQEEKAKRGRKKEWHGDKLHALYDAVQSLKSKHRFTDRQALTFMSNDRSKFASIWGPPKVYRGSPKQWVETLESRLQDAKRYVADIESLPAQLQELSAMSNAKFRKL